MSRSAVVSSCVAFGLFVSLPAVAGPIEFDNAFNFRENRVNQPLGFLSGSDQLVLGIDIIDQDTGVAPQGAIVRAINNNTGRVLDLSPFSNRGFSASVDYAPELASGSWDIVVESNAGTAGASLPAFGTGPGTGAIPGVGNLSVTGTGSQRSLNWTLPQNLPAANDGNVDRQRIRVQDSNFTELLDQRLPSPDSLDDTSFDVPDGVITHNGVYFGQVLIEGFNPFNRSRTYEPFRVEDVGVGGDPVDVTSVFNFRDNRGPNSVGFGEGDLLGIGVNVDPSDTIGTFADATQNGSLLALNQANDRPTEFARSTRYDPTLTGPWDITLYNGEHKTETQTQAIGDAALVPLVRNVMLTPDGTTPTLNWDLPTDISVFDTVQIGLFNDVNNFRIPIGENGALFRNLDPNATEFTFDDGILEENGKYVARVILRKFGPNGNTVSRGLSFINFTPTMDGDTQGGVFLPSVDSSGVFRFDIDVEELVPVRLDPFVAVGYEYMIGDGDPNFFSVKLPTIGNDDSFILQFFDGTDFVEQLLEAEIEFIFPQGGVDRFTVLGIDPFEGLDPSDVTAFVTEVKFVSSGQFTGSMTPIVVFVEEVPEPDVFSIFGLAVLVVVMRHWRRKPASV